MNGKVIVITGAGRGIGRAVCERFAAAGAQTVASARTSTELEETRRQVESHGGLCEVQPADVSSPDDVESLIEATVRKFERIDVLVNCAGVAPLATVEELDESVFDTILAVNVRAVFFTCRAVWPVMTRHGGGVIVNISSMSAVDPFPGLGAYGAAKAWVNTWTKALAEQGRSLGIRAYAVAPGAVNTRMLHDIFPDFPADRTLAPAEVAETVFAVSQPAFAPASGQVVYIRKE